MTRDCSEQNSFETYEYLVRRLEHPEWISAPNPFAYSSHDSKGERFDELLNRMGASGWELVSVIEAEHLVNDPEDYKARKYVAYFKRRRQINTE